MSVGNTIYAKLRGDRAIWMILALLALFGILAVYSATGTIAFKEQAGNTEFYLFKHLIFMGLGLTLTYVCYMIHYTQYMRIAPILIILAIPLLVYTIAFGAEINDARRWITLPVVGLTFQTSDFAKLALIIYVARAISSKQDYIKDFNSAFLPIIMPVLIICGLIAPADLSTSILLFVTCVLMMFMGRVDMKYIGLLLLLGIVVFSFLIILGRFAPDVVRVETWVSRITEFTSTDGGYQTQQAKIAIADGGLFGVGPGNSMQRNYLPAPYSDYIFATILEEYGLIFGGIGILGLYIMLFFSITRIVTRSPKAFGAMLVLGLGLSIVLQALTNMAVSVHLFPVTGLTLPMISMGGTSLIFTCIAFGMILSVSKYIERTAS